MKERVMALSARDIEIVNLTVDKAVHKVLTDTEPDRRRVMNEEAWKVAEKAIPAQVEVCQAKAQLRTSNIKLVIVAMLGGGSCGIVTNLSAILTFLKSLTP